MSDINSKSEQNYRDNWCRVYSEGEDVKKFYMQMEGSEPQEIYMTPEQFYAFWDSVKAHNNTLDMMTKIMQHKQREEEARQGKSFGRMPVPTAQRAQSGRSIQHGLIEFATTAFTVAGYTVKPLYGSPFNFLAYVDNGSGSAKEGSQTYYVLVKGGKIDVARQLSPRQLARMRDQHLMPRFGLNVVRLYWYICTADNSHRTYVLDMSKTDPAGELEESMSCIRPTMHPIPEFGSITAPCPYGLRYVGTARRK